MKQLIQVALSPINARIIVPGSKSITNRALLLAALSNGVCELRDILISDDTKAFVQALHELGIVVQLDEAAKSCIVGGGSGVFPKATAQIWCAEGGTVARFLLAACAASPGSYEFSASQLLSDRPLAPLINVLARQGADFSPPNATSMPLTIHGIERLLGGEIVIEGSESGQFISALLMIAPYARSSVTIEGMNMVSRSYVDMTVTMMAEFGVLVRRMHLSKFSIPVPQRYVGRDYQVEPDLSTASYFFAAAAVTAGHVTIQPVNINTSKQGDAQLLPILEKMGCKIMSSQAGLTVKGPAQLGGVNVDMRDYSDTFMTLAAIAPFANSPTTITNIGHTRQQESNRISVMTEGLKKLNVKVEEGPDWIRVYPSTPKGGEIDAHQDHRIAMAFSIIGLRVPGVQIEGAECVAKSCPNFFTLWQELYSES